MSSHAPAGIGPRKDQVLRALRAANGAWVDGEVLANLGLGGAEGTRRIRAWREQGLTVERRRHPAGGSRRHQYRLVGDQAVVNGQVVSDDQLRIDLA